MADSWEAIVGSLINDLDQSLAGRYSAVLYGSAARGDWVTGVSDINLLLVLERSPAQAGTAVPAPSAAASAGASAPKA